MSLAKIKVKIISTVKNEADPIPEHSEESFSGFMKLGEDGVEHIVYKSEENGVSTRTVIEPLGKTVRLLREGAIESEMFFEEGVTHLSVYKIPPFAFDMSLTAKRVEHSLSSLGGSLTLEYTMSVGGAKKDCLMRITVSTC